MKNSWIVSTVCCVVLAASPARGGEAQGWALSAGVADLTDNSTYEAGVEYRLRPLPWESFDRIEVLPAVGLTGTRDGAFWLYGNLRLDWKVSDRWVITPQFAVSLFEEGDGKDLGGPIEFRSGLEISYRLGRGSRLGVLFYHLSNSRIYEENPGSNSLVLVWTIGR